MCSDARAVGGLSSGDDARRVDCAQRDAGRVAEPCGVSYMSSVVASPSATRSVPFVRCPLLPAPYTTESFLAEEDYIWPKRCNLGKMISGWRISGPHKSRDSIFHLATSDVWSSARAAANESERKPSLHLAHRGRHRREGSQTTRTRDEDDD